MAGHHRVAIVTGAGGGTGAALARTLAARGFAVAAVDLRESWCEATFDGIADRRAGLMSFGADLRFIHEAEATVQRVTEALGPPAVVVCAPYPGRADSRAAAARGGETDWESEILTQLRAPLLISRAAERHLVACGSGRIVAVLDSNRSDDGRDSVDPMIRQGLVVIVRMLSRELAPHGVRVNIVVADTDSPAPGESGSVGPQQCPDTESEALSMVEFLVSETVENVTGRLIEARHTTPADDELPPGAHSG